MASAIASGDAFSEARRLPAVAGGSSEGLYAVLARRSRADWCETCLREIDRLRDVVNNWNSYGALPVDRDSIEVARRLVAMLCEVAGIDHPRVAASPAGNVALSWEWQQHTRELDLEIVADGTLRFSYIDEAHPSQDLQGETIDPTYIAQLLTKW